MGRHGDTASAGREARAGRRRHDGQRGGPDLGRFTIPVYEVYKVGEAPRWLPGLDLLAPLGLPVAVVPHYDNAEGGNHDTRFCYMGERRLRVLEAELPDEVFILGVDGHTALVMDLDAGRRRSWA